MNKVLLAFLITSILFLSIILSACADSPNPSTEEENLPLGFETVSKTSGWYEVLELRHLETGCHFAFSGETGVTPIFQKDGKPYCTQ